MVSHTRVKTPTAAAALLIDHLKVVLDTLIDSQNRITQYVQQKISIVNYQLSTVQEAIPRLFSIVKTRQEAKIDLFDQRMRTSVDRRLVSEQHRLELIDEKLKALDPTLLLKRGYSITIHNGRAVKDATTLQPGDEIETRLAKGTVKSIIKSV